MFKRKLKNINKNNWLCLEGCRGTNTVNQILEYFILDMVYSTNACV